VNWHLFYNVVARGQGTFLPASLEPVMEEYAKSNWRQYVVEKFSQQQQHKSSSSSSSVGSNSGSGDFI